MKQSELRRDESGALAHRATAVHIIPILYTFILSLREPLGRSGSERSNHPSAAPLTSILHIIVIIETPAKADIEHVLNDLNELCVAIPTGYGKSNMKVKFACCYIAIRDISCKLFAACMPGSLVL